MSSKSGGAPGLSPRPCGFLPGWRLELGELRRPLFGDNFLAFRRAIEGHHFAQGQLAKLARRDVETQRSVADATNLFDVVADLFKHFSDLAVASFTQRKFVPGIVAATNEFNLRG